MNTKRILLILCLMGMTVFHVHAQVAPTAIADTVIAIDTVYADGGRYIATKEFALYAGWTTGASFSLAYVAQPDSTPRYLLNMIFNETEITFQPGQRLILKANKKNIVDLTNIRPVGRSDYRIVKDKYGTYYYTMPVYPISTEQIGLLMTNDKFKKMRFYCDNGKYDRAMDKGKLADAMEVAYNAIQQILQTETLTVPTKETATAATPSESVETAAPAEDSASEANPVDTEDVAADAYTENATNAGLIQTVTTETSPEEQAEGMVPEETISVEYVESAE